MDEPIKILIADDEPLAAERLQLLLARCEGVDLLGTASDGDSAVRMAEALAPDLLLLDIAMPGLDGMGVAQALEKQADRPAIIFCTAFDQFAVAAFDVAAVDYLLKPVSGDRLAKAIARVQEKLRAPQANTPATDWIDEFWVPHRSEMIRISATDIERIEAERDYMRLHIGPRSFLLHQTISELERRLDPDQFIRLHRSTIVRRDQIAKLRHDGLGVWHADLADGTEIRIGRTYLQAAKALAGR